MTALTLLVLNLALDVVDCIRRLNLQRDGLAGQGLYEDLHTDLRNRKASRMFQSVQLAQISMRLGK